MCDYFCLAVVPALFRPIPLMSCADSPRAAVRLYFPIRGLSGAAVAAPAGFRHGRMAVVPVVDPRALADVVSVAASDSISSKFS